MAEEPHVRNFYGWVYVVGAIGVFGTFVLAIRLIWEMTWLTWKFGPQMVGFSLAHGEWALPAFLSPLLLAVWTLSCLVSIVVWKIRRYRIAAPAVWILCGALFVFAMLSIPQSIWNRIFVKELSQSSKAGDLFVYAAVDGEIGVLRGMLARGVSPDAKDYEGKTALHVAAGLGQMDVLRLLLEHHADVNAMSDYGDSPLALAVNNHQEGAQKMLAAAGARFVKGTEEQRNKAIDERIRKDIEQDHKRFLEGSH